MGKKYGTFREGNFLDFEKKLYNHLTRNGEKGVCEIFRNPGKT